ncbi:MAG: ribonuclease R [Alphaproteobacteria bacterium]|nr:ribonuclease R [Alphaproteobacteria bacterium]
MARKAASPKGGAPSRDDVLAYLRKCEGPVGVAELARAFAVKGKDRTALRLLLRQLQEEGLIETPERRKYASRQRLGPVAVLEITGPDSEGELRARPVRWVEGETPPSIYVAPGRGNLRALGPGERVLARLSRNEDGSYDARPMRRLEAAPLDVVGVYERAAGRGRIRPTDRRAKYDFMVPEAARKGAEPGDLVRARALPRRSGGLREAEVVERIGHVDSPGAIGLIALHSNDIPTVFSEAALAEAGAAEGPTLGQREDLRDTPLVTIDGEDARDFDDAVFAEPDRESENPGGWRLLVAIADVAWYVRPGGALDDSARRRGNSVYLPDRVVPMLPEALSAGLCSLKEGEDRAALAAELHIDGDGNLRRHRFFRALIRSAARLTYTQAQDIMDGGQHPPDGLGRNTIENLYGAYHSLARARAQRGTLELDIPEFQVILSTDGTVSRICRRERLVSHRLIEDFMIAANVAAAETLHKRRAPCMYRVHQPPDPDKLAGLRDFLETFGLRLPPGPVNRARDLSKLLEASAKQDSADIIHEAILRCQAQAAYSPDNIGHFGLALRHYAHFTSPIRRYADLLVHRALIGGLGLGEGGLDDAAAARSAFPEIGLHVSDTERRAQRAEREAMDRYLALYLEERVGARFAGRITGVTRFGLFVRLPEFGADGLVPASHLGDERWHHDESLHSLEGMASGTVYTLGDGVEVEIREANPVTGGLVLGITAHRPRPGKKRSRPKPAGRRHAQPRRRGKRGRGR